MSDAFVQVQLDGAGKKVQTFENTVNTVLVEAQAVVQVTSTTGLPIAPALDATVIAGNASLASIDAKTPAAGVAAPVSVTSLPLPAGAAQDQSIASISIQQQVALMRSAMQGFFAPEPQFFVGG